MPKQKGGVKPIYGEAMPVVPVRVPKAQQQILQQTAQQSGKSVSTLVREMIIKNTTSSIAKGKPNG